MNITGHTTFKLEKLLQLTQILIWQQIYLNSSLTPICPFRSKGKSNSSSPLSPFINYQC